jgi:hypothetical protein
MPSPFSGMDPFLEHPALWPDVHNALIAAIRADLTPKLRPRYVACLQERIYELEEDDSLWIADLTLRQERHRLSDPRARYGADHGAVTALLPMPEHARETFIEVQAVGDPEHVVAAIEILSPSNKRPGSEGRRQYEKKRRTLFGTLTHFVEIDLCRTGPPMPLRGKLPSSHYRVLVSRSEDRPRAALYPFSLRERLPGFHLPLLEGDEEPVIDLRAALDRVYRDAALDLRVDYRADPVPALAAEDAAWCRELLGEGGG